MSVLPWRVPGNGEFKELLCLFARYSRSSLLRHWRTSFSWQRKLNAVMKTLVSVSENALRTVGNPLRKSKGVIIWVESWYEDYDQCTERRYRISSSCVSDRYCTFLLLAWFRSFQLFLRSSNNKIRVQLWIPSSVFVSIAVWVRVGRNVDCRERRGSVPEPSQLRTDRCCYSVFG